MVKLPSEKISYCEWGPTTVQFSTFARTGCRRASLAINDIDLYKYLFYSEVRQIFSADTDSSFSKGVTTVEIVVDVLW